ncbi:hypothetical protein F2368_15175 [Salmonella enterica]|nr:hypothetical protein [Salmonella enterica]ECV2982749.1 hypothetical protein [Salmonella enterica]
MLKNILFFKSLPKRADILPLLIFRWLIVVTQVICIAVLLVGTFDIVLNNVRESREDSLRTIIKSE